MKFSFDWPCGFREVDDDGRQLEDACTTRSPCELDGSCELKTKPKLKDYSWLMNSKVFCCILYV